ncbi:MAG: cysteine desulfurase family protein [Planctomycetaceae bacterium]
MELFRSWCCLLVSEPIFLDHHSTTPVDPRVLDAMLPFFSERFGNAASINHAYGTDAADAVARARAEVATLIGADEREIVFTSGATEADNLALKGVLRAAGGSAHLLTAAAEHPAVLDPAKRLRRWGFDVTILPVDEHGRVSPEQVTDALKPTTALVSLMWANNEVGTWNPIPEIATICRNRGIPFHTDAAQAAGWLPVDVAAAGVDLLSLSAHKIYGPKGVGALYVRRGGPRIPVEPLIDGGGHERRLRSGTLPVPLIVGFGEACRLVREQRDDDGRRVRALREELWAGLCELDGVHLNGHPADRLPNNLNVSFEGVDGEALMTGLTRIAVSSGSACTSADPEPSHVLRAMGRSDQLTRASLRFGLGRETTPGDVDTAIAEVTQVVRRLRQE